MSANIFLVLTLVLAMSSMLQAHDHSRPKGGVESPRFAAVVPNKPEERCQLTLELKDEESGKELAGLIRIKNSSGKYLALPELTDRCIGLRGEARQLGWHVLTEKATLTLPRAQLKLEALSGLESELTSVNLDLRGKALKVQQIALKRFIDAKEKGWVSGNTHLHLKDLTRAEADAYLKTVPRGDGVDMVFVSYLERAGADKSYISNEYSRDDLAVLSSEGLRFGGGEEYRHNTGGGGEGYGHVMFLNLKNRILPASLGPGITKTGNDSTPLRGGILKARAQGSSIIWCHNAFGLEDIPSWMDGLVDAQNIFDGGTHGGYADTFYRYLNAGLRVPFSTGTDWFIYDFSRVYVPLGEGGVSAENWLKALASGRSTITNSAMLVLDVSGEGPGGSIRLENPGKVRVRGTVAGRLDFGRLQLIQNGEIAAEIESVRNAGHFEAKLETEIELDRSAWLALRIAPDRKTRNELGNPLFAHTSPVYVRVGGKGVLIPEVAQGLINEIRKNVVSIRENGKFEGKDETEAVLRIYLEGIRILEQSMKNFSQ